MASDQPKDVATTDATKVTTETPAATQSPATTNEKPAVDAAKVETPAKTETAAAPAPEAKSKAKATPAAPATPAPTELVAKALPLQLIQERFNFTAETTPEVLTTIDAYLNSYEALVVDGKYNTQEELKELQSKLTRSFGAALNLKGAVANAALDLIVFHFAARPTDVYTRVNLYRTPKALQGQVDRNVRFTHTLARLFMLLSVATVKSSVARDIDLPKVYEVLRSTGQQATLSAYLA